MQQNAHARASPQLWQFSRLEALVRGIQWAEYRLRHHAAPGDVVLLRVLVFVATHNFKSLQYGVWIAVLTVAASMFEKCRSLGLAILLSVMLLIADLVIWDNLVPFISGNPLILADQGVRLVPLLVAPAWIAWSVLAASRTQVEIRGA
jgi:hypothetical protein